MLKYRLVLHHIVFLIVVDNLFRNLVKPSEMPRPLALTGITAHTHKHFTSSDKTQKKKKNGECVKFLEIKFEKSV